MKQKIKDTIGMIGAIVGMFLLVVLIFCAMIFFTPKVIVDYKTIEGRVINVEPVLDSEGSIDYLMVTFDNGETYNIYTHEDVDFTVNSKIIVQLRREHWEDKEPENKWYLEQIIKAPNGGDSP